MLIAETNKQLTTKEAFDIVSTHLQNQGKRSVAALDSGACAYRGIDDCKCAIGVLMDDDSYHPAFEGIGINDLLDDLLLVVSKKATDALNNLKFRLGNVDKLVLNRLQQIHDMDDVGDWPSRIKQVGVHNKLIRE